MRDLHLWRLLQSTAPESAEVGPLLSALAELPLQQRAAFLGLLPPLLAHPDPALRAAALRPLAGAAGRPALQRLVHALGDPAREVRLAAVEALRQCVEGRDWARWVHAMFHPDPDVRLAALAADRPFPPPAFYKIFLLPDPVCRPLAEQQLASDVLAADALPLLFDYVRRGLVPAGVARRLVRDVSWNDWLGYLGDLLPRERDMADSLADALKPDWPLDLPSHYRPDRLDDVILLLWEPDPPGTPESPHDRFFDLLWEATFAENEYFQQWIAFTCLGVAVQKRSWPPAASSLVAVLCPPFLTCPWVHEEVRRQAISGFVRAGARCPKRPPEQIRPLVESPICRDPQRPERFDLLAVAGLLRAVEGSPYRCLLDWVGAREVAAAVEADVERLLPLLSMPDVTTQGRTYLVRELCLLQGPNRNRMLALLAQAVPGDQLDFLDPLDGANACAVFAHLLELEATPPPPGKSRPFSEAKIERLAKLLARKVAAGQVPRFLAAWLDRPAPQDSALAASVLARLVHDHQSRHLIPAVTRLPLPRLIKFIEVIPFCAGLPYDEEIALARALQSHEEEPIRTWAVARLHEHERIVARETLTSPPAEPILRLGLCVQLEALPDPVVPSPETCQALLASQDPPQRVVAQLRRFLDDDPVFVWRLEAAMVAHWRDEIRLPFLGHAWLWRWDRHLVALSVSLSPASDEPLPFADRSLAGAVRWAMSADQATITARVFQMARAMLEHWRWRDRARYSAAWDEALGSALLDALKSSAAELAAKILVEGRDHGASPELFASLRPRLVVLMPGLTEAVRSLFAGWIDASGLTTEQQAPVVVPAVQVGDDLDRLESLLGGEDLPAAVGAARRLLELGAHDRLERALEAQPAVGWPMHVLAAAGPIWPALRRLTANAQALPEVRFRVGRALPDAADEILPDLFDAACRPGPAGWFTEDDHDWLRERAALPPEDFSRRLICSPHVYAYRPAVTYLTTITLDDEEAGRRALLDFLELGTGRMREMRLEAATWLYHKGEREAVLPILFGVEPQTEPPPYPALLAGVPGPQVQAVVTGALMAELGETMEEMLLALLDYRGAPRSSGRRDWVDPLARQDCLGQLLSGATSSNVRQRARRALRSGIGRGHKLRRVADVFAWGVRIGRQLTGKLFTLEMIAGEDLGYTRLRENKLFISPMPLLRGQQNAREVVRALILHEYGHHLYHKGDAAEAVWQQAEAEKMHPLLNLVSDEHLERNLRARDANFGDQLKMLGAFAFQHTAREVPVETLLNALRSQAFAVLSQTSLGVARKHGCVSVNSGRILAQMERAGVSFARFVRALRMGLGNRHGDPKVALALDLFKGQRFRESSMDRLMEIARKLREIFGEETDLLNTFNQDAALLGDAEDLADASEGISNEELQEEVRRTMEGPAARRGASGRSSGRGYNTDPGEEFDLITNVVPKMHDPVRHGEYAQRVARQAEKMRRYLRELGLGYEPQRMRVRGRSFDRSRARAVVLRRDPRMLIAREVRFTTDLFLGVLIDCSGSMSSDENLEKAKLFGTLLAEAAKGNRGIDLRLWGFTDRTIYECGNSLRPAVHDLSPEDGNNDAAALWHAAQAARASERKAKLLVMISDGSPTGCSVQALQALVQRLTRRMKMICAQVAVRPLDDVCFPHHVLLEEGNLDEAVKRFGVVIMKLVRQALSG